MNTNQKTFTYVQQHTGSADAIFPLLCPERETEWLAGWTYQWVYSKSGLIEEGCVFTTPFKLNTPSVWVVTKHDAKRHKVSFIKHSPGEVLVRIDIRVEQLKPSGSQSHISYTYTALSEKFKSHLEDGFETVFNKNMANWEQAINAFIEKN